MLAGELRERNPGAIERIQMCISDGGSSFFYGLFIDSLIHEAVEIECEVV